MTAAPRRPGDQSYDGLIVSADLPDGWHLPSRFPGERDDDASAQIDAILGYNDQVTTEADRQAQLDSEQNETIDGRWRYDDTPRALADRCVPWASFLIGS